MKKLPISLLALLLFFLISCFGARRQAAQPPNIAEGVENEREIDRDYDARREDEDRKERRDEVIRRSKERYADDSACEDEDKDHDCHDICNKTYTNRAEKNECKELSIALIENFEELHEFLEDPDEDDLAEIDPDDFDVYLTISIRPLDKLIKKYNKRDARRFMFWLIANEELALKFAKEDDDFGSLTAIFKALTDDTFTTAKANLHRPFVAKLDGSDLLMEVVIASGSEDIMEWFMDFIEEEGDECDDDIADVDCFATYCKIGAALDSSDGYVDDWLDFEEFEDYIGDIIGEGTNASSRTTNSDGDFRWGADVESNYIEDIGDIDDWVEDLCEETTGLSTDLT